MSKSRFVAIGCVLAATLSACGGSGSSKPSSSGSPTTTGAAGSKSPRTNKSAPDALVLAKVMTAANFKGVQDNGGLAAENGFSSEATLANASGTVTATLYSYDSVADATAGFPRFIPSSNIAPVALFGVGDKAVSLGSTIVVRKGAQVLDASVQLSKAAEHQFEVEKETGKSNEALDKSLVDAANRYLLATTKAVVAKLSGDTGSTDLTYLPVGAVDPCGIDTTKLESGDIKVTSAPEFSDAPPMSACLYTFTGSTPREPGTGTLVLETMTTAQGAAASPPVTPTQQYASTLQSFASEGGAGTAAGGAAGAFGSDTDGPLSIAAVKNGETDFAALAKLPESDDGHIIIRIGSFRSSYVVDKLHCYDEITKMMSEELAAAHAGDQIRALIGDAGYDAAKSKISQDVAAWCLAQEQSAKIAHGSNG